MRLGKDRVDFQDLASSWWRPVFLTELQRPMLNEDVEPNVRPRSDVEREVGPDWPGARLGEMLTVNRLCVRLNVTWKGEWTIHPRVILEKGVSCRRRQL